MRTHKQQQDQFSPARQARRFDSAATALAAALLLCLFLTGLAYAGEDLVIRLHEVSAVGSKSFTVGDIADYVSGDSQLWQLVAAEPAGTSPPPGGIVQRAASGLLGLLAERGYDWRRITIEGAGVATVRSAGQSVSAQTIEEFVSRRLAEELDANIELVVHKPFSAVELPAGNHELCLRFADKPGYWLPEAVEFKVDGRLVTTLPLSQYMQFRLSAVVAPDGIPARTRISPAHLGYEVLLLAAGTEVVTDAAQVVGMNTRSAVRAGDRLRISRLKAPYDVARGSEVMLIITVDGVSLSARAIAMNDAYIGQSLLVRRVQDDKKYSGLVVAGPAVVVQ